MDPAETWTPTQRPCEPCRKKKKPKNPALREAETFPSPRHSSSPCEAAAVPTWAMSRSRCSSKPLEQNTPWLEMALLRGSNYSPPPPLLRLRLWDLQELLLLTSSDKESRQEELPEALTKPSPPREKPLRGLPQEVGSQQGCSGCGGGNPEPCSGCPSHFSTSQTLFPFPSDHPKKTPPPPLPSLSRSM